MGLIDGRSSVTVVISMLRAVNVGGRNMIKMETLRALYESLGFEDVQSYVQSGNLVFRTKLGNLVALRKRIEDAIETSFGFRPDVILRTPADLRDVIARNPFSGRQGIEPGKLLVNFLAADPGDEARQQVLAIKVDPDELHILGREIFYYFPNGMGKSKLPTAQIERKLKTPGTGRNWNTITKLLEIAAKLE